MEKTVTDFRGSSATSRERIQYKRECFTFPFVLYPAVEELT